MKYSDMNGDGVVDDWKDTDILNAHYGQTHDRYHDRLIFREGPELVMEGGFALINPLVIHTRTMIGIDQAVVPALYGMAFTLIYDTAYFSQPLGPVHPFFEDSVQLALRVDRPGRMEVATTRIDHQDQQLDGESIQLLFPIHFEDLIPWKSDTTYVRIANAVGTIADGTEIPLGSNSVRFIFLDATTSVAETIETPISVFPNPSTGEVFFEIPEASEDSQYIVWNLAGQRILSGYVTDGLNKITLPDGVFTLTIQSQKSIVSEKIVVCPK